MESRPLSFSKDEHFSKHSRANQHENSQNINFQGEFAQKRENRRYQHGAPENTGRSGGRSFGGFFESEVEFVEYLDEFKPVELMSLSSSQLINYHRFMEGKIRRALMPVHFNKF